MPNFFYIDVNGNKRGPVSESQLRALAAQGIISPNTLLKTDTGHQGKAEQIPGLFATAPVQQPAPQSIPAPVAVNPAAVSMTYVAKGLPSIGALWMHFTWMFVPLITLIIWTVVKDKEPQANTHGKHIFNAFLTMLVYNFALGVAIAITTIVNAIINETMVVYTDDPVPPLVSGGINLMVFCCALFFGIRAIVSAIKAGIAAGNGEVVPYTWAICLFKTDVCNLESESENSPRNAGAFVVLGFVVFGTIVANGFTYAYSTQKSAANVKKLDEYAATMQRETEEFIEEQRRRTDATIATLRGELPIARKQELQLKFLEAIKGVEKEPIFNGGNIMRLVNAAEVLTPFVGLDKLPEPYSLPKDYGFSVSQDVVLLDDTKFIGISKSAFKEIWDTLRQSEFNNFDPRAKDDILRNHYHLITASRFEGGFSRKIGMAVIERNRIYNLINCFPTEKQDVFDVFLQASWVRAHIFDYQPYWITVSNAAVHFYCNAPAS